MLARTIWVVLAAMVFLGPAAFASDNRVVSFAVHGKPVAQLSFADMEKTVAATQITVWEPHEDKNVTYEGFDARKLFTAVYGGEWKEIDELLFTCVDGYQPLLPRDRFDRHASYLAFRRLDQEVFNIQNRFQGEKDVPLGPFYLVWDNLKSKELRDQGANAWAYQIVGVDLVTFADRFPRLESAEGRIRQGQEGISRFPGELHVVSHDQRRRRRQGARAQLSDERHRIFFGRVDSQMGSGSALHPLQLHHARFWIASEAGRPGR